MDFIFTQVKIFRKRWAAEDIVSQQTKLLGLLDGDGEPVHGHGVLGADIDVALGGTGSHARDAHALDDLVRIALHAGAVHEGAGVALVAVADDVLDGLFGLYFGAKTI